MEQQFYVGAETLPWRAHFAAARRGDNAFTCENVSKIANNADPRGQWDGTAGGHRPQ
jgi:hypothetical protein